MKRTEPYIISNIPQEKIICEIGSHTGTTNVSIVPLINATIPKDRKRYFMLHKEFHLKEME